jgi:hypothetical protein
MLTIAEEEIEKEKFLREELDTLVPELARLLGLNRDFALKIAELLREA